MNPIVQLLITQIPAIVSLIKGARKTADPTAPSLTSEEIIRAFDRLFADDVAKDELLKAALRAEIASGKKPVE